jgi:DNA polymerase II large subunit
MSIAPFLSNHEQYTRRLSEEFGKLYAIAIEARMKGLDPALEPESYATVDVAERVEKAVGPLGVAARIRELTRLVPREEVAVKIAEEIVLGRFGLKGEASAEQAVRTAAAILDEGVTAAPIQGIASVKIRTNLDRSKHLAVYFAGPIRAAGGTEMGLILVVADYVRHLMGLEKYRPTDLEAKRFVEELRLYEREVARFQYHIPDTQLYDAFMNLPIEVNGVETDQVEVASYRNVLRVETNRVRGGALRVVNDGLIGRSTKILRIVDKLGMNGWSWLKEIRASAAESEEVREFMFMEDVVGGRPIFCFPTVTGGFRLRYGRARTTGLAALGIHPATMIILNRFIATGTQLRIEKPGKAGVVGPVDSIEPPTVKLKDGAVVRVESAAQAVRLVDSVERILFLGDLLVAFGEFLENNRPLLPSGFVEEWWAQLVKHATYLGSGGYEELAVRTGIDPQRIQTLISDPLRTKPSAAEALALSRALDVPLHPRFTYFWENVSGREVDYLRTWLRRGRIDLDQKKQPARISLENDSAAKQMLESICLPHRIEAGRIVIDEDAPALLACLTPGSQAGEGGAGASAAERIRQLSSLIVKTKAATYVGARMGRPEKAKQREMRPSVHCLFPIGLAGGSRRSVSEAAETKILVTLEVARRRCPECRVLTHNGSCEKCGARTNLEYMCARCGRVLPGPELCPACKVLGQAYDKRAFNIRELFTEAAKKLGVPLPEIVKGVRGLTSETRTPEPLEKGILRARHGVSLFKDGTIRFDATNAPLTHFVPKEAGVTVEQLRALGYQTDANGDELNTSDQVVPLLVQDIIVPEACADYLLKVGAFVDELLDRFYGLPAFYRMKSREDVFGQIVFGLSPHTSVGVVGRIVGMTKASVCFAHPIWHAAKRRDCDGDEDSVTLALDVLLNFSRLFLPSRIGGMMDAPLLLTTVVRPSEVARQAFNMEVVDALPLRFFEESQRGTDPRLVASFVETIAHRLANGNAFDGAGFSHHIADVNVGNLESVYKKLVTMLDKVTLQLQLAEKIKAVDARDVAKRVLSTHFMRDLTGNLKAFSTQRMRCTKCNSKFRRIPLKGLCPRCGGKISLTVYRGTIEKYLEVANDLVRRYELGVYNVQRLFLLQEEIRSLFSESAEEKKKHPSLGEFI